MLLKDKNVAIIGAGPVGLTMARLLQQKGISVNVYERDKNPDARIRGGTLDLHKNSGQEAMKKAGLLEQYYQLSLPMGITVVDEQARQLFSKQPTPDNQFDNPEVNRNDLRKMLLTSLAHNAVVWDSKCTDITPVDGKWLLHFENNKQATADLVIVANGGMSKVRSYVTDALVEDTGTIIIQGDILQPAVNSAAFYRLCNGSRLMAAFKGTLLVANPYNSRSLSYGVIFKRPEQWSDDLKDDGAIRRFLSERFNHWGPLFKQLLNDTKSFWALPTRKLPLNRPWKSDRPLPITLIGDAAHLMPPFAGKGVNTGLVDALTLAQNLTNSKFESIKAAIANYEQQMFVYAAEAQQASSRNEIEMRDPGFSFQKFIDI